MLLRCTTEVCNKGVCIAMVCFGSVLLVVLQRCIMECIIATSYGSALRMCVTEVCYRSVLLVALRSCVMHVYYGCVMEVYYGCVFFEVYYGGVFF